ncbi:hypothetical protein GCM10009639_02260 [Kitasatospora putterlickiae]|uniref:ATP-grasp domain-containing protein n=1 Tax=Kitasatospora putterlickiae TaxID=221725 RepID=A0ABN1XK95_9ACTN
MDGWVGAWTGGRRTVHIGNVADFNEQFRQGDEPDRRSRRLRQAHHYAGLAVAYGPDPAALVLPAEVDRAWIDLLARELDWGQVESHTGVAPDSTVAQALAARPALAERLAAAPGPVLHWGRTADLGDGPELAAVRRYESKAATHELFTALAPDHPGVRVPRQEHADTPRRAARRLTARAARGLTTVLKSPHGVGGYGTAVITPQDLFAAGGARALLRRLVREDALPPGGELLLEEYVDGGPAGSGRLRDLTFDAVIGADGRVHPVGVGEMSVDGTRYQGVTVGPGTVPPGAAAVAERFGLAVGERLAAAGHRGWYDVDFVTDRERGLAPTEANLRLTGPAIAFVLRHRLDQVRGPGHLVRTLDAMPLGARLSQEALFGHLERLRPRCERLGATVLPLMVTACYEPEPAVGLALAARGAEALDAAQALLGSAHHALGRMFEALR